MWKDIVWDATQQTVRTSVLFLFFFLCGMHHSECIAPNVDISLQSGRFWAMSIAPFRERLLDFRSCWIVFIHVVRGRPGGLNSHGRNDEVMKQVLLEPAALNVMYSASQKHPPCSFLTFLPNSWEFLVNFLHIYYTLISTLDYKFLFNYLQLWQSYAILSETSDLTSHRIFCHYN